MGSLVTAPDTISAIPASTAVTSQAPAASDVQPSPFICDPVQLISDKEWPDDDLFDGAGEGLEEDDWKEDRVNSEDELTPAPRRFIPHYVMTAFNEAVAKWLPGNNNSTHIYSHLKTFWVPIKSGIFTNRTPNPRMFWQPRFFVWDPQQLCSIVCPNPGCSTLLTRHGNLQFPRRVVGPYDCYWLIGVRYKCFDCSKNPSQVQKTWNSWSFPLIASLPKQLSAEFPTHLSHRSGIDKHLFNHMLYCFNSGLGPKQFSDGLRAQHKEHFDTLNLQYLDLIGQGAHIYRECGTCLECFGTFAGEYGGFVPSAPWLKDMYDAQIMLRAPELDQHMAMLPLDCGSIDHSHEVCFV
jgi:hypothetical protein